MNMATATQGIDQIVKTVIDGLYDGSTPDDPVTRVWGRVCLSPAIVRVLKIIEAEGGGIFWAMAAIASWTVVTTSPAPQMPDGELADDEREMIRREIAFHSLVKRWPVLKRSQWWVLRKRGHGADLMIRGGFNETEDDSLTEHLVQRFGYADFPWGDADRFEVRIEPQEINGQEMLVAFMPQED
jgi:hypothetical protein